MAYTDVDVTHDADGRAELVRRTGQMAVPVVVVGEDVVVGFDRPRLARLLGLADG